MDLTMGPHRSARCRVRDDLTGFRSRCTGRIIVAAMAVCVGLTLTAAGQNPAPAAPPNQPLAPPQPLATPPAGPPPPVPPTPVLPPRPPQPPPAAHVTLDRAIELALQHNHTLLAARTMIDQNRAQETTAFLRPNPDISWDAQFLPFFSPQVFSADYLKNNAQFDVGIDYLIERGKKRQRRLDAARDQTAVTTATVSDNERTVTASVAQEFIGALLAKANLELARTDLDSFQQSMEISEAKYQAGATSEGDLLKIKLQMLQFQMDLSAGELAKAQALFGLRQLLGFESVPENYDVDGELDYQQMKLNEDDLKMLALRSRPDLRAAQLGITAAQSQYSLARANAKHDLSTSLDYSRAAGDNTASVFFSIPLPIFERNQGEIARTQFAITQAQENQSVASEGVLTDVVNAYENLRSNDEVVNLYTSGYLKQAEDSRDISQYAYQRGAASLLDYLDAERSYRATELGYHQALAQYMLAVEQMRQAVGTRSLP
jgi:cobalt-zinc-cadmium efflux system outer membrane protein